MSFKCVWESGIVKYQVRSYNIDGWDIHIWGNSAHTFRVIGTNKLAMSDTWIACWIWAMRRVLGYLRRKFFSYSQPNWRRRAMSVSSFTIFASQWTSMQNTNSKQRYGQLYSCKAKRFNCLELFMGHHLLCWI